MSSWRGRESVVQRPQAWTGGMPGCGSRAVIFDSRTKRSAEALAARPSGRRRVRSSGRKRRGPGPCRRGRSRAAPGSPAPTAAGPAASATGAGALAFDFLQRHGAHVAQAGPRRGEAGGQGGVERVVRLCRGAVGGAAGVLGGAVEVVGGAAGVVRLVPVGSGVTSLVRLASRARSSLVSLAGTSPPAAAPPRRPTVESMLLLIRREFRQGRPCRGCRRSRGPSASGQAARAWAASPGHQFRVCLLHKPGRRASQSSACLRRRVRSLSSSLPASSPCPPRPARGTRGAIAVGDL